MVDIAKKAGPVVKWVGGKRQLLDVLLPLMQKQAFTTYIEPFIGGGSGIIRFAAGEGHC